MFERNVPADADLSIVIPTYNRPALLHQTIQSVLSQTRQPREIIVVDNGTDDATADLIRTFGAAIIYIRQEPLGVQVARNTGALAASSTWVAMLDDDDLYLPEFVKTFAAAMEDGCADIICGDHRRIETNVDHPLTRFEKAPPGYWDGIPRGSVWSFVGKYPAEKLITFVPFFPSTMVLRKDLFLKVGGYDPQVRGIVAEDIEFLVRALLAGNLAIVWPPLLNYRLHGSNDSGPLSGGYLGQIVGKWRIFEFLREKAPSLDATFAIALEEGILPLRAQAFDAAFGLRQFDLASDIARDVRSSDWSIKRSIKRALIDMPLTPSLMKLVGALRPSP